jgi:dCMP deaminase
METNDKWDKYFMTVARTTAELSYCVRLKVGAVAVRDNRIIAVGYNGTISGFDNRCEITVGYDEDDKPILLTLDTVEHAERNLIAFAAKHGIALAGCTLYITHAPCADCARAIINSGFTKLVYGEPYKTYAGLHMLQRTAKVEVKEFKNV